MTELTERSRNLDPENRVSVYKKMLGESPQALFVLSGGTVYLRDERLGVKRSISGEPLVHPTTYSHSDSAGMLWGEARAIAAGEVSQFFPEMKLYTLSSHHIYPAIYDEDGIDVHADIPPTVAMRRVMIEAGANPDMIVEEHDSTTTLTEIMTVVKTMVNEEMGESVVLTNLYHIERAKLLLEKLEDLEHMWTGDKTEFRAILAKFRVSGANIRFVGAESILIEMNPDYEAIANQAYASPQGFKRLESEAKGSAILEVNPSLYGNPINKY